MTVSEVAIRRPVFTSMLALTLLVLGFLGYSRLGIDLYPSATIPFCQVTTVYPGAAPIDVEGLVTRPIEDAAAGIAGVEHIFSQSRENASVVFIAFKMNVSFAEAVQQVRDKVSAVQPLLPQGVRSPVISQFDINSQPALVFTASSSESPLQLHDLLAERVRPRLEKLAGVAAARVVGGSQREVLVELDGAKLRAMQIPPEMIAQKLRAKTVDMTAGRFIDGAHEVNIRVSEAFADADSLRRLVLAAMPTGQVITLGDIASVRDGAAEARTLVRLNGQEAIAVEVLKQSGANTVEVARAVRAEIAAIHTDFGDRFQPNIIADQSVEVEANTREVWHAIYFGGAMAVLVILLFLLDWRGTLISALALPTSVVGTLFVMWILGFTLNQLTLLALSLAIGLLIDDAVVVRESITRRLEAGEAPERAAAEGTREIALAVMATTFTLCAVFVPVAFMQGMVGQFFRQFGLTMAAAVLISLFIALTLDPMLSARFVKPRAHGEASRVVRAIGGFFERVEKAYGDSLAWVLRHRGLTVLAAALVFGGSIYLGTLLGTDFLGAEDWGGVLVSLDFPPGTRLATAAQRSSVAEAEVRKMPGVTSVYAVVGNDEQVEKVTWRVALTPKDQRTRTQGMFKDDIRAVLKNVPEAKYTVSDVPMVEGAGEWPPILMRITGPDLDGLRREAAFLADTMRALPGAIDVQVNDTPGRPEVRLEDSKNPAVSMTMPAVAVGMQVRLATFGDVVGKLRGAGHTADIRLRLADSSWGTRDAINSLPIWSQRGPLSLAEAASLRPAEGPTLIEHENRERQISVAANLAAGADLGSVTAALRQKLVDHKLEPGYAYVWSGQQRQMVEMIRDIAVALVLAVVFIFMVLASQFESLVHPLTIMLSLPMALVGAVLGLALGGFHLAIGAFIGVILLMGLVTKNSILLVDGALQNVRAGEHPNTAMENAGRRRLRPILMTSAAMVLGMLPTAIGRGAGSEFRAPMAIAVIGGVITSTLLTLWVVPAVFVTFEVWRNGPSAKAPRPGVKPSASAHREKASQLSH